MSVGAPPPSHPACSSRFGGDQACFDAALELINHLTNKPFVAGPPAGERGFSAELGSSWLGRERFGGRKSDSELDDDSAAPAAIGCSWAPALCHASGKHFGLCALLTAQWRGGLAKKQYMSCAKEPRVQVFVNSPRIHVTPHARRC